MFHGFNQKINQEIQSTIKQINSFRANNLKLKFEPSSRIYLQIVTFNNEIFSNAKNSFQ